MRLMKALAAAAVAGFILGGCAVDADGEPDVITTPGNTTVIEKKSPDVHVNPPDIIVTPPSTTTTTTGN